MELVPGEQRLTTKINTIVVNNAQDPERRSISVKK